MLQEAFLSFVIDFKNRFARFLHIFKQNFAKLKLDFVIFQIVNKIISFIRVVLKVIKEIVGVFICKRLVCILCRNAVFPLVRAHGSANLAFRNLHKYALVPFFIRQALAHEMLGNLNPSNVKNRCRQVDERNKVADLSAARERAARNNQRHLYIPCSLF